MSRKANKELASLFQASERAGRCAVGCNSREQQLLRRRLKTGEIVRPLPKLYARAAYWEALSPVQKARHIIRALSRLHPQWVFCLTSAAIMHGMEVAYPLCSTPHILSSHAGAQAGVVRHALRPSDSAVCIDGVRVTSAPRTVVDCARSLSFPYGLAVADSALRVAGCTKEDLLEHMERYGRCCPGIERSRVVVGRANPLSENGGESYARAVMLENGVRAPELQVPFSDWLNPGKGFRVDFLWRMDGGIDVAGELDGREKVDRSAELRGVNPLDALREERQRESRLTRDLRMARFTYRQVRAVAPFLHILREYGVPMDGDPRSILEAYRSDTAFGAYAHLR